MDGEGRSTTRTFESGIELVRTESRDVEGPDLTSFTMSPGVVDVGRVARDVTVGLSASDASKIEHVSFICEVPVLWGMWFVQANDPSLWGASTGRAGINRRTEYGIRGGDRRSPTLTATLTVPFGLAPRSYACEVHMQDSLGNFSATLLTDAISVQRTAG